MSSTTGAAAGFSLARIRLGAIGRRGAATDSSAASPAPRMMLGLAGAGLDGREPRLRSVTRRSDLGYRSREQPLLLRESTVHEYTMRFHRRLPAVRTSVHSAPINRTVVVAPGVGQ